MYRKHSLFFRMTSLVLSYTFFVQQIVYASDISYGIPIDNEENRSGFMSAAKLDEAQRRQEELVRRLQESLESKLSGGAGDESGWTLQRKTGTTAETTSSESASCPSSSLPETQDAVLSITTAAGDVIGYSGGKMARVELPDGTVIQDIEVSENGDILRALISYPDGGVLAVEGGKMYSYLGPNGTAIHYDANERIESIVAPDGLVSYYTYEFDQTGNVAKTTVTSPETIIEYDSAGRLRRLVKTDGTTIDYEGGIIIKTANPDGSRYLFGKLEKGGFIEVKVAEWIDKDGNSTIFDSTSSSAAVDGSIGFSSVLYDATTKTVKEVIRPNGDVITYTDGLIDGTAQGSDPSFYSYAFSGLGNITEVCVDRNEIKRIYDRYGNLKSLSLDGVTKITYANGTVKEIVKSDGTTIRNMTFRESGELDGALISYPDGSVALYDDAKLLQVIGKYGTIDYVDGKIRKITLGDGTVYYWSYRDGRVILLDETHQERRTYAEGKLIELEELGGARLTTRYYYDATSCLVKSEICKNQDVLYAYAYTYEDGLTLIHDIDGNVQAYTNDKKLSYIIDSKGRKYSYTYVGTNEGYVEVYFPSGERVKYDTQGGIIEVKMTDGAVVTDIVFSSNIPTDFKYRKGDITYIVEGGKVREAHPESGAVIIYDEGGFVRSLQSSSGEREDYEYFIHDAKIFRDSSIFQSGILNRLKVNTSNYVTYLELSRPPLDLGNGSDGDFVSQGEVRLSGVKNYKSFYLQAGHKIIADDTLIIKSLGNVRIDGIISADGYGYTSGYGVGQAGASTSAGNAGGGGGGGGGYVNNGGNGGNSWKGTRGGSGGPAYGNFELTELYKGSAGGRGGTAVVTNSYSRLPQYVIGAPGGGGGGAIKIIGKNIEIAGTVSANGLEGGSPSMAGAGGGGSGGSIYLVGENVSILGTVSALGGAGGVSSYGGRGGAGSNGRIRVDYCNNLTGALPASAYKKHLELYKSGTFDSEVIEMNPKEFGEISWSQDLPTGTHISFQTRAGNTPAPDATWSEWSGALINSTGSLITSPVSHYIQYRVSMSTDDLYTTPRLRLGDLDTITIRCNRSPNDISDFTNLEYLIVLKNGVTAAYNKSGLLIWTRDASGAATNYDPLDAENAIDIFRLMLDRACFDRITAELPNYLLNETQKQLYLRDNIIISELTAIKSVDGTTVEYTQGQISKITKSDGTVIQDIGFDARGAVQDFTYIKDGKMYIVRRGVIDEVISQDTHEKYYPYGLVRSIETSSERQDFEYGIESAHTYATGAAFRNGVLHSANYRENDYAAYLELSNALFDFGNGADGNLRVDSGQTVTIDGTKNYRSIYIAAGATVTVSPWNGAGGGELILKSQGPVIIDGTLTVSGKGYRGGSSIGGQGAYGEQGESINGKGTGSPYANYGGGGGGGNGVQNQRVGSSAGGGGYGVPGKSGGSNPGNVGGSGGASYGDSALTNFYMGSGGGKGGAWWSAAGNGGNGGNGGGRLRIIANSVTVNGAVIAEGGNGKDGGGGGGSGGAIWITGEKIDVCGNLSVKGGIGGVPGSIEGGHRGGDGGEGRIRIDYGTLTGNVPASAYKKQIQYAAAGAFESEVIEVDAISLDALSWSEGLPEGTQMTFQTRSGGTPVPDEAWSEWSEELTDPTGSQILSPARNYMQYKVNLSTTNTATTPQLIVNGTHNISVHYLKFSEDPLDPYVRVKENGITSAYNKSGILIWVGDISGMRTYRDPSNSQGTIDLMSLKFASAYLNLLKEEIPTQRLSDGQKVITVYDKGNDTPIEIVTADQSITYFDQGYATKVVDKDGTTQVLYTYDENKNILKAEFVDARKKLEENYQKALTEIVTQKEEALAKLVIAEAESAVNIAENAADIRKQVAAERQRLTQERSKYDPNVYDLSEFTRAFAELDEYEARLAIQERDAYSDLDNQIASARARIEADAQTAMRDLLDNDYNKILADIVQKESSPVIYHYYRKILGRDPGEDDLLYWTDKAKAALKAIDPAEISQYLQNLQEYSDRQARKDTIINHLAAFFSQYLAASDVEKTAMLTSLGLSADEVVSLTQDDVDSILAWLRSQSLHFGDSAIETVVSMLRDSGINKSFADVGKDALKIDILAGVITKNMQGDLLISMYALRKVAELNGLVLHSEKLTYGDLRDQVSRGTVTVHIDGKHYVVVTHISDSEESVTYIDPTVGKNGSEMTVSRVEFMETWKGYSLSKELLQDPAKQLNVTVEKNIRGSGWWQDFWKGIVSFFQKVVAPVATILIMFPFPGNLIGAALHGLNIIIQTVSFVVRTGTLMDVAWAAIYAVGSYIGSQVLPGIYESVRSIFSGVRNVFGSLGNSIFAPLKGVFSGVMPIFNNLSLAVSQIATGVGHIVSLGMAGTAKVAESIGYNIITQGVSLGSSFLFKSMRIDPSLTNIGAALMTGAIMGAVTTSADAATNIVSETLRFGTISGVEELGRAVDLDPNITHLAAITSGALVGGIMDIGGRQLTYEELAKDLSPTIASEFAYLGLTDIGTRLGLDPRISYLAGIGIRSSLQAGLGSNMDPGAIWNSVTTGLLQGVTNIGLSYATQELGISPLLTNIGFSAISGGINAGIQAAIGGNQDVFDSLFETYKDNALTFLGYADPSSSGYAWQQAAYISQILDFSNIVQERGLVDALNTYGAGFFNAVAVNNIVQSGYTLGSYFAEKLQAGQYATRTLQDGKQVKEVVVKDAQGNTITTVFFEQKPDGASFYWDVVGREDLIGDDSYLGWGELGIDAYGKLGYTDAELYSIYNSDIQFQRVRNGQQTYAAIKDAQGNILLIIEPTKEGRYNVYNSHGEYTDAKIYDKLKGIMLTQEKEEIKDVIFQHDTSAPKVLIPGEALSQLLFSKVEDGKITVDKLVKKDTWNWLIAEANATENITDDLTAISNSAIAQIDSGGTVDLTSLATSSKWQTILNASSLMKNWADKVTILFLDTINPVLAPGTAMLMNVFGNETFRMQLKSQAQETFSAYNLYEQLASAALGDPGAGTIMEKVGAKTFWEGVKSMAQLALDNRDAIISSATELTKLMQNPLAYLNDSFWNSETGQEFIRQRNEFLGLIPPKTNIKTDAATHAAAVDPDLSYWYMWGEPVLGMLDTVTLVQVGNMRWDRSTTESAPYYETLALDPTIKGISISGVNTDGAKLDELTKRLSLISPYTFTITNSAASDVLIKSNVTTEKLIVTNSQTERSKFVNWIDKMGLSKGQVLVVDVLGDFPYRPVDLLSLGIGDLLEVSNPLSLLPDAIFDTVNNKGFFDYSNNPDNKYIHVQIISGPGVGVDPFNSHSVAINGALDPNAKYTAIVNGVLWQDIALKEIYEKFLKDELS